MKESSHLKTFNIIYDESVENVSRKGKRIESIGNALSPQSRKKLIIFILACITFARMASLRETGNCVSVAL
jgi:hypothetical protein